MPAEKRPTDTVPIRARLTYAELDLMRDIAAEQKAKAEKQTTSAVLALRDALLYFAKNEYPPAYRKYLVAVKGKVR